MISFMCVMMSIIFKLSIFVETNGIGTPAASGTASSINTVAAFAISLFFTTYLRITRRYAPAVSMVFAMCCFLFAALATDMVFIYCATVCMGLCMGTINPYLFAIMSNVSPDTRKTIGMTMMCIFQLAGQIFTPYYMMGVAVLGFADERSLFWFTAGVFGVAAVVLAILFSIRKPKEGTLPSSDPTWESVDKPLENS
jgi:MFS family permease